MSLSTIADYAAHVAKGQHWPSPILTQRSVNSGSGLHAPLSSWVNQTPAGAAPSTAVAPDYTTVGCIGQITAGAFRVPRIRVSQITTGIGFGMLMLADRLSHQGGLSGNTSSTQTTNLPTAALTRSTSGVGVMAAIEVYSVLSTTAITITASYTNSAGTSGRTSKEASYSFDSNNETSGRLIILPPADGDVGVRSVESVTLSAPTGVVGNIGVTLFKPYLAIPWLSVAEVEEVDAAIDLGMWLPSIPQNACLWWITMTGATQLPGMAPDITTFED